MDPKQHSNLPADQLATRHSLQARLDDLIGRVDRIEDDLRGPLAADSEDQAAELADDETLIALDNAGRVEIAQIRAALARIEAGTFGICTACGNPVGPVRLAVLPTATRCIDCAEAST